MTSANPGLRKRSTGRSQRGASLALVAAFAIVLGLCIWAALGLAYLFNGSQQVRNAVDSGALATAQKVLGVKAVPNKSYVDVADSSGNITLSNINRVWGKALIVNANVQSMQNEGQALGQAASNGKEAFTNAKQVNDQLQGQLTDTAMLSTFFNQIAGQRNVSMLGSDASMKSSTGGGNWPTALLDRGAESNLSFNSNQLPQDANLKLATAGGSLAGYSPVEANGENIYFVPFRSGEMPHLVSSITFDMNRTDKMPLSSVQTPIPNGFSVYGSGSGSGASVGSSAFAITNPQRRYQLGIPYAYVSIQITNTAKWYVQGKQVAETTYGTTPETQWEVKSQKLTTGGMINGYASLGNEYQDLNLYWALNDIIRTNPGLTAKIVQRLQEIEPNFSKNQLMNLLTSQQMMPGVTRYLLYPVYSTPDHTDPTIKIAAVTGQLPSWLTATYVADGREALMPSVAPTGAGPPPPPEANRANIDWQVLIGATKPNGHHTTLQIQDFWEPDSGLGQCLGQVRVAHTTNCYFAEE